MFLFGRFPNRGACLHQFPSRLRKPGNAQTTEKCDLCVVPFSDYRPFGSICVGDIKNSDPVKAERETALYAVNGIATQDQAPQEWAIQIGIPTTRTHMAIHVYLPTFSKTMWRLAVCEGKSHSEELLCTLYVGVHYLCLHGVFQNCPFSPTPFKELSLRTVANRRRVLVDDECYYVYKLFDKEVWPEYKVNLELMRSLHIECEDMLPDNGRLSILRYPWIPEGAWPTSVRQFEGALKQLSALHRQNLVHGDIRLANIIFSTEATSHLIDFDLAGSTTDMYPLEYNTSFTERHPGALPGKNMRPEHDKFAMYTVITQIFGACLPETIRSLDTDQWLAHTASA